jgi:hypothetical protein
MPLARIGLAEGKATDYLRTIGEVVCGFSDRAALASPPGI